MAMCGWYTDGLMGEFREKDYGKWFQYKAAPTPIFGDEYPFLIAVGQNGEFRYGNVTKTRAYIVVDEADDGSPVVEKWVIKNHSKYDWK